MIAAQYLTINERMVLIDSLVFMRDLYRQAVENEDANEPDREARWRLYLHEEMIATLEGR